MIRFARTWRFMLVACVLAGCTVQPAQVGMKPRKPAAGASPEPARAASPAPALATPPPGLFASAPPPTAGAAPPIGAGIVANNGGNIITNNGAALAGTVRVPAGLLSNNGGALVSNNGGSLITDNGGSLITDNGAGIRSNDGPSRPYLAYRRARAPYRLARAPYRLAAAPTQVPVAGARVRLVDATGDFLRGPDGQPVAVETDAAGAYRFPNVPPDRHWVVTAELPGEGGRLRALAPRDAADRQALDVDYVSTLATVYVLEKYVASQPDRQATLEKLPAAIEAETRARTAAALAASEAAPTALDDAAVLAAVEGLRAKDTALNEQLEAVRRLLIPAGQSDLGAGRLGTQVALGYLSMLLPMPDGALLIAAEGDRRLWRLGPDGRLTTLAGGGGPTVASVDGQVAATAGLTAPTGALRDAQGRVIILEEGYDDYPVDRVTRVEADGTLRELWHDAGSGVAAVPGEGDEVLVVCSGIFRQAAQLVAIAADGARTVRHTFPADQQPLLRATERYGRDAQGRIWLGANVRSADAGQVAEGLVVYTLEPATGALTRILSRAADGLQGLSVDAGGNVFYLDATRRLMVRTPAGTTRELLAAYPAGVELEMEGVALMPDGTAFVTQGRERVYRVANGALTLAAGTVATGTGHAQDLALDQPSGVAPLAAGGMYVADEGLHRIVRIDADGRVTPFAGTGEKGYAGDDGPAGAAKVDMPRTLRLDAAGNLYFIDNQGYSTYHVRRIGTDGRITTRFTSAHTLSDLAVEPDGTAYVADFQSVGMWDNRVTVRRLPPAGKAETIVGEDAGFANLLSLALGPAQELFLLNAGSQVVAWLPGPGLKLTTVGDGEGFLANDDSGFAIDADYRFYFADRDNNVVIRWDPKLKAFETVAGVGGRHFKGTGVDDGLERPGHLAFGPDGALLIVDVGHKQVKRIPKAEL